MNTVYVLSYFIQIKALHVYFKYKLSWCVLKVTFAPNLAKKISTNFYYLSLLFQLSGAYSENFKEIKAWEVYTEIFERKNRNLTNLFRLAAKADRVTLCQVCTKIL